MSYPIDVLLGAGGRYLRPGTITDNVANPKTRQSLSKDLDDINNTIDGLKSNINDAKECISDVTIDIENGQGDWFYEYHFTAGNKYTVSNIGSAAVTLQLFDSEKALLQNVKIDGLGYGQSVKFTSGYDAVYIGGYSAGRSKIRMVSDNSVLTPFKNEVNDKFGVNEDFTLTTGDWSKDYIFIKGRKYLFTNKSSSAQCTLKLYDKETGRHQDVAPDASPMLPLASVEFTANNDYNTMQGYANNTMSVRIESVDGVNTRIDKNQSDISDLIHFVGNTITSTLPVQSNWTAEFKFRKNTLYRAINVSTNGATSLTLTKKGSTKTQVVANDNDSIQRNTSVEFFADDDYDGMRGYSNNTITFTIEMVSTIAESLNHLSPRVTSVENEISNIAPTIKRVDGQMNGIGFEATLTKNPTETTTYVLPCALSSGNKYEYEIKDMENLSQFFLYGCNSSGAYLDSDLLIYGTDLTGEFVPSKDYSYVFIFYRVTQGEDDSFTLSIDNSTIVLDSVEKLNKSVYGIKKSYTKPLPMVVDDEGNYVVDAQGNYIGSSQMIKVDIPIAKGDSISATYEIDTDDFWIFAYFDEQNQLIAQTKQGGSSVGSLTHIAEKDYAYIYAYIQRNPKEISDCEATISISVREKSSGGGEGGSGLDVINVVDYGADPTGTEDSYEAINSAITDAIRDHKSVYIPYGTFLIGAPISINTNQPLVIYGYAKDMAGVSGAPNGTVLKATKSMAHFFEVYNNQMYPVPGHSPSYQDTKICIRDMMVAGASITDSVMYLNYGYVELERVYVSGSLGEGVVAEDCYYAKFKDVIISGCQKNGLHLKNQANIVHIVDSQITGNGILEGYANVKVDVSDVSNVRLKNCNVVIESTDLSSTINRKSASVDVSGTLAMCVRDCYFESHRDTTPISKEDPTQPYNCAESPFYYHVKVSNTVNTFTLMNNFIFNGNVMINSQTGAMIGNDFCTNKVYNDQWGLTPEEIAAGKTTLETTESLRANANIADIANHFYDGYTKTVI